MNPNTMTAAECADWCAMDDGWRYHTAEDKWWKQTGTYVTWSMCHPHPLNLDGAAEAMPEGYEWERRRCIVNGEWGYRWFADTDDDTIGPVPDTGDEIAARYRLAVLCRLAMKEASNGKA